MLAQVVDEDTDLGRKMPARRPERLEPATRAELLFKHGLKPAIGEHLARQEVGHAGDAESAQRGTESRLHVVACEDRAKAYLGIGDRLQHRPGNATSEHAVYRVVLDADEALPATSPSWRGRVAIAGQWEVPAMRFLRYAASVAWREAGF